MKIIMILAVVLLLSGCAMLGALFAPGERGPDGKRKSLGRDLGGAVQMAIEGEWIAAGVAGLGAIFAAGARYFFRRGEKAEIKKVAEIEEAVAKKANGNDALVATPASATPA